MFFVFLTIVTQIGGILYIASFLIISNKIKNHKLKRIITFVGSYLFFTFILIPKITPFFGRIKISDNNKIEAHNFITKLCNRNYVTLEMYDVLTDISVQLGKESSSIKLIYLDANFPFFDGFPLLPHLSHNDGKKIDVSFIYKKDNKPTNLKPSRSGYGVFVKPKENEVNQTENCKEKKYWQYDFTKYVTFGAINNEIEFSKQATKKLIKLIASNKKVSKIFIEPHIKARLNLNSSKIRFHGCQAVRHDDHIHFQIK